MPANLSPEYKAAADAFRKARDPAERLEHLREITASDEEFRLESRLLLGFEPPA